MGPDDRFLLGTDLAKDRAVLEAAYDDAQGVTARFNRNLLARINRELGADFDLDAVRPRGPVSPRPGTRRDAPGQPQGSGRDHPRRRPDGRVRRRESIHTENSHKYTADGLHDLADRSGFVEEAAWTDRRGYFRSALAGPYPPRITPGRGAIGSRIRPP